MKLLLVCLACCVVGCGGGNREARITELETKVENLENLCKKLLLAHSDNFARDMESFDKVSKIELKLMEMDK